MNKAVEKAIKIAGSQKQLAKIMGVSQPNISSLLKQKNLRPSTCKALSVAVNGAITPREFEQGFLSTGVNYDLYTVSFNCSW